MRMNRIVPPSLHTRTIAVPVLTASPSRVVGAIRTACAANAGQPLLVSVAVRVFTNYQSPITGAARALCAAPAAPRTPPPPALGSDSAPPETRSAAERQTPRFAYTNHPRR